MNKKKIALTVVLSIIGISMVLGIVMMLIPTRFIDYRIPLTVMIVGAYALAGLILVAIRGKMHRSFQIASILFALSMVIFVTVLWVDQWLDWDWEDRLGRWAGFLLVAGLMFTHRMLVSPLRTPVFLGRVAQRGALISGILLTGIMSLVLVFEVQSYDIELLPRLAAIFAIVGAGSTFIVGILSLFGPKPGDDEPGMLASHLPIQIVCPRCNTMIEAESNKESRCGACRLKVRVEIEEPRCVCGYLLYQLESDVCPECGRSIPE